MEHLDDHWIKIEDKQPQAYDMVGIRHDGKILFGMALYSMTKWRAKTTEGMIEIKEWQPAEPF